MTLPAPIPVQLPPHVTPALIARLAREVAMEIRDLPTIIMLYELTPEQYARISELPFYKRVYEDFVMEWSKVSSTRERINLISAILLEEGLPKLGSHMLSKDVTPSVAVETGKFFAKMAGVEGLPKAESGSSGDKFVITINLGEDSKLQFTKDVTPKVISEENSDALQDTPQTIEPIKEDGAG